MAALRSFCTQCKKESSFNPSEIKHKLHFFVSCFTLGIWLPVWFILNLARKWVCNNCGYDLKPFNQLED